MRPTALSAMTSHLAVLSVHRTGPHPAHRQRLITHYIVTQGASRRGRDVAVLLALADRFVILLPDELVSALGLITPARQVKISAEQQRHIVARRQVVSQLDADLAAHRLSEAIAGARLQIIPQRRSDVFEIIGHVESTQRHLLVALKLVPASRSKGGDDEWWIQTAFPAGSKRLRRLRARGEVRIISPAV